METQIAKTQRPGRLMYQNGYMSMGVTVILWTSSHILYGLPLHQKGNISKATC